jgi:hypothetical protein
MYRQIRRSTRNEGYVVTTFVNAMSPSRQLRAKIDLVLPLLTAAGRALINHPNFADLYPRYLFTLHCMTRATVPMMQVALDQARLLAPSDPVAAKMVPYLEKHIPEEMHSHWVLEDLEALGYDRTAILRQLPSATVAALIGAQYYWIAHYHPVALFGYMEIAEGYPPTPEQVNAMIAATGYPAEAFRSLRRHAYLDLEHREELHAVLDSLPVLPEHAAVIGINALQSVELASRAIQEIVTEHAASMPT